MYFACDVAHRVIVVEMAQAAGLPLLNSPSQRNPLETTSYGVGQILQYALRYMEEQVSASGATDEAGRTSKVGIRVLMGIGGSATNDGGLGALQALGLDLYVRPEEKVAPLRSGGHAVGDGTTTGGGVRLTRPFRGKDLERLTGAVVTPAMQQMFMHTSSTSLSGTPTSSKVFVEQFFLICDVDNPLVGPRGATYVFGPQKCAPVAKAATSAAPAAAREAARVGKPSTSQKASSSSSSSSASSKVEDVEEGAVGVVNSAEQQAVLDRLERGMQNAARAVVISTWPMLSSYRTPTGSLRGKPFACSAQSPCSDGAVEAQYQLLLHGPGGGGAGGMSGFFRYVLAASWLPGADAVAALLGLRLAPPFDSWLPALDTDAKGEAVTGRSTRVAQGAHAPPMSTSSCSAPLPTAASTPHGRLFTDCDVLVTGEGSFDSQTILSHKTVGRLLEMTVEANAWRMYAAIQSEASRPAAAATIVRTRHASLIREVLVVCGRCGFDSPEERQQAIESALCTTLLPTTTATSATSVARESTPDPMQTRREELQRWLRTIAKTANVSDVEALRCVTPKITVLPLTPDAFPVRQAMQSPYPCVVSVVERYLSEMDERGGGSGRSSSGAKGPAQRSRL